MLINTAHSARSSQKLHRGSASVYFRNRNLSRQVARRSRQVRSAATGDDKYTVVIEQKTGIKFPSTLDSWVPELETMRSLGAACREKSILMFSAKVYAISLYVEGAKATRELGIRNRGGLFQDDGADEYCDALLDGGFGKMLALQLARDIDGDTFVAALDEALEPRMSLSGELRMLQDFKNFFLGRKLTTQTNVLLLWQPAANSLQIKVVSDGSFKLQGPADAEVVSASLCRALFEVWMGSNPVIPDAKAAFAEGARKLIDSDTQQRDQFKPGGRLTPNP